MEENIPKENEKEEGNLKQELDKCARERDEYLDGWKRAKADLSNYKKDEQKRLEEVLKFGYEEIIRQLVRVLDSFDLALSSQKLPEDERGQGGQKGIYLIRSQLEDTLKKYGLEPILASSGSKFDPALHEALISEDSKEPTGTIIEEIEKGYRLHGRVIRPSRVKVVK